MGRKQTSLRRRSRARLSAGSTASVLVMVALGGAGAAAVGAVPSSAGRTGDRDATARVARTIWVHESVHATNVSHRGESAFTDRGLGKGTFNCVTVTQIRIYYTTGSGHVICTMRAGSIESAGKLSFFSAGRTATFTGTVPVTHGTGQFSHASGKFRVEGTVVRKTYAVEASTSGWLSY